MTEITGFDAARERLRAGLVHLRRLAQHPRRSMAVDGGLLALVLVLVGFDIRGKFAFVIALGVIALHLKMRTSERGHVAVHSRAASQDGQSQG